MKFWLNLFGFQLCWVLLVGGAGRGMVMPGLIGAMLFSLGHFYLHPKHGRELALAMIALVLGGLMDFALMKFGVVKFATPSRFDALPPGWMMGLWWIFALTLNHSMAFFHGKPWLCRVFGFFGGMASYYFAARTWGAVEFLIEPKRALLVIGAGWALVFPFLIWLAPKFLPKTMPQSESTHA